MKENVKEAWQVVVNSFAEETNHESDHIPTALLGKILDGSEEGQANSKKLTSMTQNAVLETDTTSEAVQHIAEHCENLNEFAVCMWALTLHVVESKRNNPIIKMLEGMTK
jgi:hypothetical protein